MEKKEYIEVETARNYINTDSAGTPMQKLFADLCVLNSPRADVVPRSEVDGIVSQALMETRALLYSAYDEIAELKQAKQDVAREIFEEIERNMVAIDDVDYNRFRAIGRRTFADLKKKYIGEEKYEIYT